MQVKIREIAIKCTHIKLLKVTLQYFEGTVVKLQRINLNGLLYENNSTRVKNLSSDLLSNLICNVDLTLGYRGIHEQAQLQYIRVKTAAARLHELYEF